MKPSGRIVFASMNRLFFKWFNIWEIRDHDFDHKEGEKPKLRICIVLEGSNKVQHIDDEGNYYWCRDCTKDWGGTLYE